MKSYGEEVHQAEAFTAASLRRLLSSEEDLERVYIHAAPPLTEVCQEFGFRLKYQRLITALDLTKTEDELWAEMTAKRRNGIRYAQKHGVKVSLATAADAEEFVPVWVNGYCAKYGRSTDNALPNIERWIKAGMFFIARLESTGNLIAGSNFRKFTYKDYPKKLLYSANSSLENFNKYKPNELLVWEAAKWAKEQGYEELVLGTSESVFKRQFSNTTFAVDEWVRDAPN